MIPASAAGTNTATGSNGWITIHHSRSKDTSGGFASSLPEPEPIEEEPLDSKFKPYWGDWLYAILEYLWVSSLTFPDPLPAPQARSFKSPLLRLLRHTIEPLAR